MGSLSFGGKREWLARGLFCSGASLLLSLLPARNTLLVLNYHRIGNAEDDLFDPGVFSATADELDDQIFYLKSSVSLVTLQEALAVIDGTSKETSRRCRVLITFDDGYLDNYSLAFPVLRSHGVQGVFFVATSMVGSCHLPWWDRIAYLIRTAQKRRFTLGYPAELTVNIDEKGLDDSLREVLRLYKRPENSDPARFINELSDAAKGNELPESLRRFLSWDEAREMTAGGMVIGSHTHSHHVLSQLEPERQLQELSNSRAILKKQLGVAPDAIAYPVGGKSSFTELTQSAVREAGYRAAFSFYGGVNSPGSISAFDVKRIGIGGQSWNRFRVQAAVCRATGRYWP